jgi:hypothetical protein
LDTAGDLHSGDFDLVSGADDELAEALLAVGFRWEDRQERRLGGFHHPTLPIGAELESGAYFDGRADRSRVRVLELPRGEVLVAPTEDLIADRLGQWIASDRRDGALLR